MRRAPLLATAALALALALPAAASANQTLSVEKAGTGTGTVVGSAAPIINCGPTCSGSYADGTTVTLTGSPGANSQAVQWAGCDSVNVENKCKVTLTTARTVKATFDLVQRELKVSKAGLGTGTVTSSPSGIACGETCSAGFGHGSLVTLSAISGPNTAPVLWSGCDSVNGENKCLVTMNGAKAITATFNLNQVELKVTRNGTSTGTVASSPAGINCGVTVCAAKFGEGTTVTLTGAPAANTEAAKWTGCTSVDAEDRCLVTMSGAKAVTATFSHPQLPLAVAKAGPGSGTVASSPAGIDCGSTCQAGFDQGSTVTLTATPGPNSLPAQWTGCDTVNVQNKCEVKISAAREVTATFKAQAGAPVYTVSVTKGGTGSGSVSSSPLGIDCGATCSIEVVFKTPLALTATPDPGSVFAHWSGGTCTGSGPCERNINSTRTVKAVFEAVGTRTLAISLAGSGSGTVGSKAAGISCSSSCSPQVSAGTKITLTAKPAAGSSFAGFSGACTGIGPCKVQLSEAKSVTATFTRTSGPQNSATASVANKAKVKAAKAYLRIHCEGPASCRGSLKLSAKLQGKSTPIGSASFSLAPGSATTLKVGLSAKAMGAMRSAGKLRARVSGSGISPHAVALKLGG
jgi:hypothetical protein